jgi:hypothetical protein
MKREQLYQQPDNVIPGPSLQRSHTVPTSNIPNTIEDEFDALDDIFLAGDLEYLDDKYFCDNAQPNV